MPGIKDYSTTPGSNVALFPEGQTPSSVNDGMRQVQADIRAWYNDAEWIVYGDGDGAFTISYASATSFTVSGIDVTAEYHPGRRVKATGALTGTIYGTIASASFAASTTVTVAWDSGSLQSEALTVHLAILRAANLSLPSASTTAKGAVELATVDETQTGTDAARAVHPQGLGATASFQGKQTIWVPAAAMRPRSSNGCAPLAAVATGAGQPDIVSLDFDAAVGEAAQFTITMPKSWNKGTLTWRYVWSHAAAATDFGVVFYLKAVAVGDNEPIGVAFGTSANVADAGGVTNNKYISAESGPLTAAGTLADIDTVFFEITRDVAHASDTLAVDARLMGGLIHYTTNVRNDA